MTWQELLGLEKLENVNPKRMTLDELKTHSRTIVDAMKKVLDAADVENRDVSRTEVKALDEAQALLDKLGAEMKSRPVNQPPPMSFTSGESPQTATAYGAVGKRYAELFYGRDNAAIVNEEDPEAFLARAFSQRTMFTGTGASGGFLVPEQLWKTVFDAALAESICMQRCRMFPMETSSLTVVALDSEDQSSGWTAGVQSQWKAEGATFDLVTPAFRTVNLSASKLGMFVNASSEILQDAPNLESVVSQILVGGVTQSVDNAVINGSGVGQPLGILNSPCAVVVGRQTSSLIDYTDLSNMYSRLHPSMIPGAVWIASSDCLPQFLVLEDPASQYIWMPSATGMAGPTPGTLMGLPLFLTDKAPSLGTRGDLQLVNLNYYGLGVRKGASVESTNSAYWTQDLVSFRCIMRVDGKFLLDNPVTPANGGDTLSCAVILDA